MIAAATLEMASGTLVKNKNPRRNYELSSTITFGSPHFAASFPERYYHL